MSERQWHVPDGGSVQSFMVGKTVERVTEDWQGCTTYFTDGSAVRCQAVDGTVYSEWTADPATVEWEVSDSPVRAAPAGEG